MLKKLKSETQDTPQHPHTAPN